MTKSFTSPANPTAFLAFVTVGDSKTVPSLLGPKGDLVLSTIVISVLSFATLGILRICDTGEISGETDWLLNSNRKK